MDFENKRQKPITHRAFLRRLAGHVLFAAAILVVSLFGGMFGYEYYEDLSWLDAFLNASMLLGGMGPVNPPVTAGGKLFAGLYALYAGLIFLVVIAIVLAPVMHRVLHTFHADDTP